MRARFVLSEMALGLRRNLTMTVAVIVTVAISLALLGAGLLIRKQIDTMKDYWYDKVEVSVFLQKDVTASVRDQIGADLRALPATKTVFYESQAQAYQRFQEQFKDSPDLVKNVSADALPESYRVKLKDPKQYAVVASAFTGRPGVDQVVDQRRVLDRLFRVLNGFQVAALFVALVQIAAAALLISNTIRVAAFSRRRETGIMRLVGASNFYIQLPFLLEGALSGLIGAAFAGGALALIKKYFVDQQLKPNFQFTNFIGWDAVFNVIPWLVLLGVGMSAIASFVTLRRYLRV